MLTTTLAVALCGVAMGPPKFAPDWLDNFNDGSATDGSPVSWVDSPAFGSAFEVVDGDLVVSMAPGASVPISSPRVGNYFADGASVRARMVAVNGPGRYTVAFADAETGIKGYVASFSTCQGGRVELFRGDVIGQIVYLGGGSVLWPYSPVDGDFYVQLDVFEGVVSARVWRPGEAFPEAAISAPDMTYPDGVMSIAIQDFGSGASCGGIGGTDTSAVVRFAQAASNPLTSSGRGDINVDGQQDFTDVLAFLTAFADMGGAADLAEPFGQWDFSDVVAFLVAFSE